MAYQVKHINDYLIQITDEFQDAIYILKGRDCAILWDLGMDKQPLKPLVDNLVDTPYHVVFSHGHLDHVGCGGEFETAFMSMKDKDVYFDNPPGLNYMDFDKIQPMPSEFDLGDRKVQIMPCPGHTQGSVLLIDTDKKLVFTGDAVGSGCGAWIQVFGASMLKDYAADLRQCINHLTAMGVDNSWAFYGGHAGQEYMSRTSSYNKIDLHLFSDMAQLCDLLIAGKIEYEPSEAKEFPLGKPYFAMYKKAEMVFTLSQL